MSNYTTLKTTINANIRQNGNQEITGKILNSVLNAMVNTLGEGYQFAGIATTETDPGTPDAKVFYIANGKGEYAHFWALDVTEDEVVFLVWDNAWHKVATGIAADAKLKEAMTELAEIAGKVDTKQDIIPDLDAIREGAGKGSTALQKESDPVYLADRPSLLLAIDGKVSKEPGKGLSHNDFTDTEKAKLAGLENYDDTEVRELIDEKANEAADKFNAAIVQEIGDSQDKVMSQKAVTDALTASDQKLSELEGEVYGSPDIITIEHSVNISKAWTFALLDTPIDKGILIVSATMNGMPYEGRIYCKSSDGTEFAFSGTDIPYTSPYNISSIRLGEIGLLVLSNNVEVPAKEGIIRRIEKAEEHSADIDIHVTETSNKLDSLSTVINGKEEEMLVVKHTAIKTTSGFSYTDLDKPVPQNTVILHVTKDDEEYNGSISYKTSDGRSRSFTTEQLPYNTVNDDIVSIAVSYVGTYSLIREEIVPAKEGLVSVVKNLGEIVQGKESADMEAVHSAEIVKSWENTDFDMPIEPYSVITSIKKDGLPYDGRIYFITNEGEVWALSSNDLPKNSGRKNAFYVKAESAGTYEVVTKKFNENALSLDERLKRTNILFGKKWAVIGDSFSEGQDAGIIADGKYAAEHICYPYIIGNKNNMDIQRLFLSGRMITTPTSGDTTNSVSTDIYQQVEEDVDYITLYLGINDSGNLVGSGSDGEDYNRPITIGDISSNDIHTFYGAWNVVLKWLIENRPLAHIGIIVSNGMDSNDMLRKAEIELAKKWGVPYIDLNGDDKTPMMHRSTNPIHSQDAKNARLSAFRISELNTHPNAEAYEYESSFIENFLRTL